MKRWLKIYRGVSLLGYAGLDEGLGPCHPFEAANGFWEVEPLFTQEHELTMQLADDNVSEERVSEIVEACEALMEEILAPGVSMKTLEDTHCFDCMELTIGDGRVCWR
jgi:hypothetical protein